MAFETAEAPPQASPEDERGAKKKLDAKLFRAATLGNADKAARLLAKGADPNARFRFDQTALMSAAFNSCAACIELLLPSSDPDLADIGGQTALIIACALDNQSAAQALLPLSDPFIQDIDGRDALATCAAENSLSCLAACLGALDRSHPLFPASLSRAIGAARSGGHEKCLATLLAAAAEYDSALIGAACPKPPSCCLRSAL